MPKRVILELRMTKSGQSKETAITARSEHVGQTHHDLLELHVIPLVPCNRERGEGGRGMSWNSSGERFLHDIVPFRTTLERAA